MVWVGALTSCVDHVFGTSPVVSAWLVAALVLGTRWVWLWHGDGSSRFRRRGEMTPAQAASLRALEIYAAVPNAAFTVGLILPPTDAPSAASCSSSSAAAAAPLLPQSASSSAGLPSLSQLYTATVGLASLAGAWIVAVSLNYASMALWATPGWPSGGMSGLLADAVYALALSATSITLVALAKACRQIASDEAMARGDGEAEALSLRQASGLVAETVTLAVASGWAWFNAITAGLPALVGSPNVLARGVGAALVSTCVVIAISATGPLRAGAAQRATAPSPPSRPPSTRPGESEGSAPNRDGVEGIVTTGPLDGSVQFGVDGYYQPPTALPVSP